jgi:predicted RecA/RadA family phage recombinase
MATDWWPSQEGRIVEGLTINCIAEGAITEGHAVKWGTSTSGQITVAVAVALGDGFGVALKAAGAAGDAVPVMILGIFKCTIDNGNVFGTQGEFVMNSGGGGITDTDGAGTYTAESCVKFGGSSYVLGMLLQTATADADEVAVLIGKSA